MTYSNNNIDDYDKLVEQLWTLNRAEVVVWFYCDDLVRRLAKLRAHIVDRILERYETTEDEIEYDVDHFGFEDVVTPPVRSSFQSFPFASPGAVPGPRFRADSVSAPVGRDGSAQHRKKAANDENDA